MSALASGARSIAQLPVDQIVRLAGPTCEQLTVSLDPLPDGAPVVIRHRLPLGVGRRAELVDDVLDGLEQMARELFPAWLARAEAISNGSDFERRVVTALAHDHAAGSEHFGPFLAAIADAALRGCPADRRFEPRLRARGLARIIGDSYRRTGVVLLVGPDAATDAEQRCAAAAYDWLASHGIGVWLASGALPAVDRFPTWQLPVPGYVVAMSSRVPAEVAPTAYPALAGRPHPASVAEQALERGLARCAWAVGRTWNQEYASGSLAPPIRVDLMWPTERCVVEIDGPDHRGAYKYAADRRRDNGLTLDGFAVLRFTNDEILDDPHRVLDVIARLITARRHDEGNTA